MTLKASVIIGALVGTLLPTAFIACSLGEGVTPKCDPDASPDQENACFQVSSCDNGNGGVKPEESCCIEAGNQEYAVCDGKDVGEDVDFRDLCVPGMGEVSGCCNPAQQTFDFCMAGSLSTSSSTGGGGGAGGAGGNAAGGAGGNAAGGNAAGGSGGTGGAGGAGGN